jgi:type II secretory pathway pseudopilin PulG
MYKFSPKICKGITSIEVVIGVSIASVVLIYAAHTVSLFINTARDVTLKTQAVHLAEEALELTRFIRDEQWTNISGLSTGSTHYLAVSGTTITTTTTPEVIGVFTRSFRVENVYRDTTTDDVVASTTGGSVADTDSKYITATVVWGSPVQSISLTTILADIAP